MASEDLASSHDPPSLQVGKDDPGMKAVLKALRAEYLQINEMEERIQRERIRWMQTVENWLDQQEQVILKQRKPVAPLYLNGKPSHPPEPSTTTTTIATADSDHSVSTFRDGWQDRPGPRPSPPPQIPELDDGGMDPDVGQATEFELSDALQKWERPQGGKMDPNGGTGSSRNSKGSSQPADACHDTERRLSKQHEAVLTPAAKRFKSRMTTNRSSLGVHPPDRSVDSWLCFIVMHPLFDSTAAFMIIVNSVIIGFTTQWLAHHEQEHKFSVIAGNVCSVFFLVELILRMCLYRKRFFTNENKGWNIFDFMLVSISVLDFLLATAIKSDTGSWGQSLKTIKMLRIIRVFRVFRFFRELSLLALMIVDSLYSLTWALILLMIIIYVFSICFTTMATDYIKLQNGSTLVVSEVHRYFGSLPSSIYTLLLSMLSGASWGVFSDALMDINAVAAGLFLFYAAFTILAVMNIITGVFVDNAVETARTQRDFLIQKEMELKEKYASEMRGLFQEMDKDGSGTISYSEVQHHLTDQRVQGYFAALGLDPNDTERLFRLIDDDESGDVNINEFLDGCIRLKGQARSIDVYAIMRHIRDIENQLQGMMENLRRDISMIPGMPQLDEVPWGQDLAGGDPDAHSTLLLSADATRQASKPASEPSG